MQLAAVGQLIGLGHMEAQHQYQAAVFWMRLVGVPHVLDSGKPFVGRREGGSQNTQLGILEGGLRGTDFCGPLTSGF